jgi:hypothetical protein
MLHKHPADVRAASALRGLGRRRRKHRRVQRAIESVAAIIPSIVLILHLLGKSDGMAAEPAKNPMAAPGNQPQAEEEVQVAAAAEVQVVAVPEPNATALMALGAGLLFYFHRKTSANQSSKTATAVA